MSEEEPLVSGLLRQKGIGQNGGILSDVVLTVIKAVFPESEVSGVRRTFCGLTQNCDSRNILPMPLVGGLSSKERDLGAEDIVGIDRWTEVKCCCSKLRVEMESSKGRLEAEAGDYMYVEECTDVPVPIPSESLKPGAALSMFPKIA